MRPGYIPTFYYYGSQILERVGRGVTALPIEARRLFRYAGLPDFGLMTIAAGQVAAHAPALYGHIVTFVGMAHIGPAAFSPPNNRRAWFGPTSEEGVPSGLSFLANAHVHEFDHIERIIQYTGLLGHLISRWQDIDPGAWSPGIFPTVRGPYRYNHFVDCSDGVPDHLLALVTPALEPSDIWSVFDERDRDGEEVDLNTDGDEVDILCDLDWDQDTIPNHLDPEPNRLTAYDERLAEAAEDVREDALIEYDFGDPGKQHGTIGDPRD